LFSVLTIFGLRHNTYLKKVRYVAWKMRNFFLKVQNMKDAESDSFAD